MMSGRLLSKYSFRLSESVLYKSKTRLRLKGFSAPIFRFVRILLQNAFTLKGTSSGRKKGYRLGNTLDDLFAL